MPITSKDKRWVALAKKMLPYSNHHNYRMVAVLVKGGRIISYGTNSIGPAAFFLRFAENRGRHCEVRCLFGLARKYTKGATLYVVGETKLGNIVLSKPCPSCLEFIGRMGLRRVVYHSIEDILIEELV